MFFVCKKKLSESLIPSFLMSDVSEWLRSLTKNEWCEQIAQVAHQKWATMSNSLRWLTKNERPWANRSGGSPKMSKWVNPSFFEWTAHSLIFLQKNKRFDQKTDERIPSPVSYCTYTVCIRLKMWKQLICPFNTFKEGFIDKPKLWNFASIF